MFKIKNTIILAMLTSFTHCANMSAEAKGSEEPVPQTERMQIIMMSGKTIEICGDPFVPRIKRIIREKCGLNGLAFELLQDGKVIFEDIPRKDLPITVFVTGPLWGITAEAAGIDVKREEKIRAILRENFPNTPISFGRIERPEEDPRKIGVLAAARAVAGHAYSLSSQISGSRDRDGFINAFSDRQLLPYFIIGFDKYRPSFYKGALQNLSRLGAVLTLCSPQDLDECCESREYRFRLPFSAAFCPDEEELKRVLEGEVPKIMIGLMCPQKGPSLSFDLSSPPSGRD